VIHFDQTGKRHDFPQRVPNVGDFRVFSSNQVMFWSESQLIFWDLPLFLKRAEEEKKKSDLQNSDSCWSITLDTSSPLSAIDIKYDEKQSILAHILVGTKNGGVFLYTPSAKSSETKVKQIEVQKSDEKKQEEQAKSSIPEEKSSDYHGFQNIDFLYPPQQRNILGSYDVLGHESHWISSPSYDLTTDKTYRFQFRCRLDFETELILGFSKNMYSWGDQRGEPDAMSISITANPNRNQPCRVRGQMFTTWYNWGNRHFPAYQWHDFVVELSKHHVSAFVDGIQCLNYRLRGSEVELVGNLGVIHYGPQLAEFSVVSGSNYS